MLQRLSSKMHVHVTVLNTASILRNLVNCDPNFPLSIIIRSIFSPHDYAVPLDFVAWLVKTSEQTALLLRSTMVKYNNLPLQSEVKFNSKISH